jgi:hypothetical protein
MGLLSRRKNGLTAELESLQHRKAQLTAMLTAAEQRLDEATRDRQTRLLESDLTNGPPIEVPVFRFTDERDAVVAALTAIDAKILDAQASVDRERDRIRRETGSKELAAAVEDLAHVQGELAAVAAKVAPALSAVLAKLPAPHPVSPERVGAFLDGVLEAAQTVIHEAQSHAGRLTSGDAEVVREVSDPVIPPAPKVERLEIFPLQPSRWVETDGSIRTVGAHVTCDPPVEVARAALANGNAILPLSDHAIVLRQRVPPCYANYPPADCLDIAQPKPLTKPVGTPTAAQASIHSEFAGHPRVGTARVARV